MLLLNLASGCATPTRSDVRPPPTTQPAPVQQVAITLEKLKGALGLEAGGQVIKGLENCTFAFRLVLPGRRAVRLLPAAAERCVLKTTQSEDATTLHFDGNFLDGVALLESVGVEWLAFTFPPGTLTMNGLPAPEIRARLDFADGYLSVNGVRTTPLPNIVY
jgi:hypothetical protein